MSPFAIDSHHVEQCKDVSCKLEQLENKPQNNPRVYRIGSFPTVFNYLDVKGDSLFCFVF